MYLYRPVLGSPHFWQTDKAPQFLKPRFWIGPPSTSAQNWRVARVDNMGALGLWSELVK